MKMMSLNVEWGRDAYLALANQYSGFNTALAVDLSYIIQSNFTSNKADTWKQITHTIFLQSDSQKCKSLMIYSSGKSMLLIVARSAK